MRRVAISARHQPVRIALEAIVSLGSTHLEAIPQEFKE
jgi:hypothetical protein